MKKILMILAMSILLVACVTVEPTVKEVPTDEEPETEVTETIEVTIDAEPIIQEIGKIHIIGETNLPDYAELMFTVTGDNYTAQTKEVVMDGKFKTDQFSNKGEPLSAGEYSLSISLSISPTQDEKFVQVAGENYEYLTGDLMVENDIGKTMSYDIRFKIEEVKEAEEKETTTIDTIQVEEIIDYSALGDGDKLVSASAENGEIKVVIELAPHDLLPAEDLAITSYSQASDALLEQEGWEVLTIEYVGIGKVSMKRTEIESNEFGDYFPSLLIEEKLKK